MFSFFNRKADKTSEADTTLPVSKELLDMQSLVDISAKKKRVKTSASGGKGQRVNSPIGVDPKAMARAAAARIDAIEQEIALDLRGTAAGKLGMHPRASEVASRAGFARVAPPPGVVAHLPAEPVKPVVTPGFDYTVMPEQATTLLLGDTNLSAVIEVKETHIAPAVEEAAVLHANGKLDAAIDTLVLAFKDTALLGKSEFNAYRMLFDLLRLKNDHETFDRYALDFAVRFEKSPPSWRLARVESETKLAAIPTLDLGEMLDGSIAPVLEQLKVLAQRSKRMRLDAGNISNINYTEGFGCELLLRVLAAFEKTEYELELIGTQHLFRKLKPFIQAKQKRISGHLWLLYLEMLRMQNQRLLFDDIALKFAMVYEVSPPSWRAPSNSLTDPTTLQLEQATIMSFDRPDHIQLSGEITGTGDALINQLANGLHVSPNVVCDCRELKLIGFEVAGRLLTALTAWTSETKTVEFKNLSHPIASLFVVLGVQHLAVVERRRDA